MCLWRLNGIIKKQVFHILFRWQEAHEVIVKEIAPEAVIGQEYDYLHRYFCSVRAARKSGLHLLRIHK